MLKKRVSLPAILALFVGLLFAASTVQAQFQSQGAIITGKVVDGQSGQPVSGIEVTLEGTDQSSTTNDRGMFSFTELQPGTYTVKVESEGYEPFTQDVEVEDRGKNLNIELTPSGTPHPQR